MIISATQVAYYQVCKRKVWLFGNAIAMEHTSDTVYEGKLIGENTYPQRSNKHSELQFDGVKIDFFDAKNKVVHETKKSNKVEAAHLAQVKYYLWKLEQNGIAGATGIIEYPKQRATVRVEALTDSERAEIMQWEADIERIVQSERVPPVIHAKICKSCSYFDFCYAD